MRAARLGQVAGPGEDFGAAQSHAWSTPNGIDVFPAGAPGDYRVWIPDRDNPIASAGHRGYKRVGEHVMDAERFTELVLRNEVNRHVLAALPALGLTDSWLVSGSLFQTVWNVQTSRDPGYGIKDYDIFYFDSDTSWEAEDEAIARGREIFAGLGAEVEIRNQARVHLWYERKFGMPYPPLGCACDGIDRFLAPACMVGISATGEVYAPRGFDDIEQMVIRPNPVGNFDADELATKAARWKDKWPELTVVGN